MKKGRNKAGESKKKDGIHKGTSKWRKTKNEKGKKGSLKMKKGNK